MFVRPAATEDCFEQVGAGSSTCSLRALLGCGHTFVIDAAGKATSVPDVHTQVS